MRRSWQADHKRGALSRDVVVAGNLAPMLFDDAVTDAEAESGTLSNFLGGKERVEYLVRMSDALAIIRECDFHEIFPADGRDLDAGRTPDFMDGIVGVIENIQEYLLQLVGIADDLRQRLIQMLNNVDAMTVEIVRAQLDRASQDRVQLQSIPLWRHLARETEKVLHDLLGPLRLL